MDIKTAFLDADIEGIFMQQTEGHEKFDKRGKPSICKLRKSLFGLKHSSRNWYIKIKVFFIQLGFTAAIQDERLFKKKGKTWIAGMLCHWVDDMLVLRLLEDICEVFKNKGSEHFQMSSYEEKI